MRRPARRTTRPRRPRPAPRRTTLPAPSPDAAAPTWAEGVRACKRQLLEAALLAAGGNRTHAARALGLQRTYLVQLLRDLDVVVPTFARMPR